MLYVTNGDKSAPMEVSHLNEIILDVYGMEQAQVTPIRRILTSLS